MTISTTDLAGKIEHTLLRSDATPEQIDALCDEAVQHNLLAVCVNPVYVAQAVRRLARACVAGSDSTLPFVVSVAGFPLGASTAQTKADEARRAMDDGAVEIDMVARVGALVVGDGRLVRADIEAVASVVHTTSPRGKLKVILETRALHDEAIILGCRCCIDAGGDFVKTSTGFHPAGGATIEHVRLLHHHAAALRVKAAGGIRDARTALAMIEAGAMRIGTSAGATIMASYTSGREAHE